MNVQMEHAAMRAAVSDVTTASELLAQERIDADRRVSGFLGSGWTGRASTSFAEAWEDWRESADQVKAGLDAMSELLDAAHRDMTEQDHASQEALDRISALIVDRLG